MKINWYEYYREFARAHGGNPVLYRFNPNSPKSGYLLFSDGWQYSRTNPSGPEYPPPEDSKKHLALIRTYWTIRLRTIKAKYAKLKDDIESLARAQAGRSATIQVPEREDGRVTYEPISFQDLLDELSALAEEIRYCNESLANATITAIDRFEVADIKIKLEEIDGSLQDLPVVSKEK